MNESFPTVRAWSLPEAALTRPAPAAEKADAPESTQPTDPQALCEALTPIISAAIARRARQRRYTR